MSCKLYLTSGSTRRSTFSTGFAFFKSSTILRPSLHSACAVVILEYEVVHSLLFVLVLSLSLSSPIFYNAGRSVSMYVLRHQNVVVGVMEKNNDGIPLPCVICMYNVYAGVVVPLACRVVMYLVHKRCGSKGGANVSFWWAKSYLIMWRFPPLHTENRPIYIHIRVYTIRGMQRRRAAQHIRGTVGSAAHTVSTI